MGLIGALLFLVILPAGIAWALAHGLGRLQPGWSLRRRTLVAALAAGFAPIVIPVIAVLAGGGEVALLIAVAALLFAGLVIAVLVGLPIALAVGRKQELLNPDPRSFD